eukprot:CAMPEP_0194541982 /NCGR_PEP_ID=MMETSP0253-20130528/83208_1 /TAXON_ID=2966 /ORGANISM="Noctiluca scintillans" /LENGTH=71 /DNA_ID=CAMNT_0039388549 /DNA_START=144 /DNA_END=360 /DNA_ORIENTATION=+
MPAYPADKHVLTEAPTQQTSMSTWKLLSTVEVQLTDPNRRDRHHVLFLQVNKLLGDLTCSPHGKQCAASPA